MPISTKTDVSWFGPEHVTMSQHPATSVSNGPGASISQSVGTPIVWRMLRKLRLQLYHHLRRRKTFSPKQQIAPVLDIIRLSVG